MIESLFGGSNDTINILGGIGFFVIVAITAWVLYVYIGQIKSSKSEGELAEENWDGIGEYKNPLPTGWAVIFAGLIVWAVWYYLAGYPLNSYSQIGEWNKENKEYKAEFAKTWANPSEDDLRGMGESIFLAKCAPCHGNTADGMGGKAADLTKYGHKAHIEYVVKNGSKGLGYQGGNMPAGLVSGDDVSVVADYVSGGLKDEGRGREIFINSCASCHGEDGKGMYGTFPDLTTYGSVGFTTKVIKLGKTGDIGWMPSFAKEGTLTDIQYKAVATYVLSIGQ